jgi:transposase
VRRHAEAAAHIAEDHTQV